MPAITRSVSLSLNCDVYYQVIDGWGVNINAKYWNEGKLIPAIDMLIDDLGCTIFRLDAWGKSNWVDPESRHDKSILTKETYEKIYTHKDFASAVGMGKYLNEKGIEPYITISGLTPTWMCGDDGLTLEDYDSFCEMTGSYIAWLRNQGVSFTLFGPLNETDLGGYQEGPAVNPSEYVKVCELLIDKLADKHLNDVKLVVAEQGVMNTDYIEAFCKSGKLVDKIAVFGMHTYSDYDPVSTIVDFVEGSSYENTRVWMTEYGDLEQTGDREFYTAWVIYQRLVRLLEGGMTAALNWDAFDNYHDHNEFWTIYGLLRTGLYTFTPKKRYHACKQIYRYVRPGYRRIATTSSDTAVTAIGFSSADKKRFTISGQNDLTEDIYLRLRISGFTKEEYLGGAYAFVTTESQNCCETDCLDYRPYAGRVEGFEVAVPAKSIYTITNVASGGKLKA